MIFVLDKADFSANNIGKIQLPYYSELATELMSKIETLTDDVDRQYSFAKFIDGIVVLGLYDNLKFLAVPALTNNITDATRNLITNTISENIATQQRYRLGKYGLYSLRDRSLGNISINGSWKNTTNELTLGFGSIQKEPSYFYGMAQLNFRVGQDYVIAGYDSINIHINPIRPLIIGSNASIQSIKGDKITTEDNIVIVTNGTVQKPKFPTNVSKTDPIFNTGRLVLAADTDFQNNVAFDTGMQTIIFAFDKALSEDESIALSNLVTEFENNFYENDIKNIELN